MNAERRAHDPGTPLAGNRRDRLLGCWSARAVFALAIVYLVVLITGFAAVGDLRDPLPDPYLAIAEVLTVATVLPMVLLMAAVHACAPGGTRTYGMLAFGWMLLAAVLTMTVHVVELTVARRIDPVSVTGFEQLFAFTWPSVFYAVDIVAWDLLLGLSLLCAAPVFAGGSSTAARRGLVLAGLLCVLGLIGPAVDDLAWRAIGVVGYTVVFPGVCLALARVFDPHSSVSKGTSDLDSSTAAQQS